MRLLIKLSKKLCLSLHGTLDSSIDLNCYVKFPSHAAFFTRIDIVGGSFPVPVVNYQLQKSLL